MSPTDPTSRDNSAAERRGELRTIDGHEVLRFQRRFAQAPDAVWAALTEPDRLAAWLGAGARVTDGETLQVGSPIRLAFAAGAAEPPVRNGQVVELEPGRAYAFTWDDAVVRIAIAPDGSSGGTRLVLEHRYATPHGDRPSVPAREAAGWDQRLGRLDSALTGASTPTPSADPGELRTEWIGLRRGYLRDFAEPGVVSYVDGRPRLRIDRWFAQPAERIWAALTENDQLAAWHFPVQIRGRFEVGEPLEFVPRDPAGGLPTQHGQVVVAERPRVLAYTWADDLLRWEIWAFGPSDCRLVLTHTLGPGQDSIAGQHLAGWHAGLGHLAGLVSGHPTPRSASDEERLARAYASVARAAHARVGRPIQLRFERIVPVSVDALQARASAYVSTVASDGPERVRAEVERTSAGTRLMVTVELEPGVDELGALARSTAWSQWVDELAVDAGGPSLEEAGALATIDGRPVIQLVRRLPHPPEKVWAALTDPAHQGAWFPARMRTSYEPGAPIRFEFLGPDGEQALPPASGRVLEADPPRLLTFSWEDPTNVLRFELEPAPADPNDVGAGSGGCVLRFANVVDEGREQTLRNGAGWAACLDLLVAEVSGTPAGPPDWASAYVRLDQAY